MSNVVIEQDKLSDAKHALVTDYCGVPRSATLEVHNPATEYTDDAIISHYKYQMNHCEYEGNKVVVTPRTHGYVFRTERRVRKTGLMMVGWGGNNGTTVTAGIVANKHHINWMHKNGPMTPNYYGSLTQATTVRMGWSSRQQKDLHVPFNRLLPMVNPDDLVLGGWDISSLNIADSMERACVIDYDLQRKLRPLVKHMKPLPSIYYPDFIAANQKDRADNLIPKGTKAQDLAHIRNDIRTFKQKNGLDYVVVLWTANTERFVDVRKGLNMTGDEVLAAIARNDPEVSQSQIFAVAAILENCPYVNGSPQNTLVPGVIELAERHGVFVCGDDLKSGQTKMKSVMVDFLVSAGLKVSSIVSYNHLGNNDGKNLSSPKQFRSKEISKSNVVDDMVAMNTILYGQNEHPDHVVVIKYVPFVKDSKRAMDEYVSTIFMNGQNTIAMHNTCEDSLLAAPIIIDLCILNELFSRITYKAEGASEPFQSFHAVLSACSYLLKAPMVPKGTPVVNALMKQHRCITNIMCAVAGVATDGDMLLEHKTHLPAAL